MIDGLLEFFINTINLLDIFFLVIVIYCVIQCFLKGFSLSLISFMKWVLSTIITIILVPKFQPLVSEYIQSEFINKYSVDIKSAIGFDLIKTISKGQQKLIDQTSITQPAILFTSYLYFKMITELLKVKPNVLCGHSLGEYSALTCANSIPIFNALRLVHNRGLLMERARKGSMYAVLNFDLKKKIKT